MNTVSCIGRKYIVKDLKSTRHIAGVSGVCVSEGVDGISLNTVKGRHMLKYDEVIEVRNVR